MPPPHAPQDEHPLHDAPADEQPELVYRPLHVCDEPVYLHVPPLTEHDRVQDCVELVLETLVHGVVQLQAVAFDVAFLLYPELHDVT